ncbi:MAG: alpha/beta hydrolase [Sphingomonas sp.]|uniref:alpha/beta hydrolase n=1 Tax=Sphingomonas sp. TaxID=28214 RepID=UPI003F81403F
MTSLSRRSILAGAGALGAAALPGAVAAATKTPTSPPEATLPHSEMFALTSAEGRTYGVSIGYPLPDDPDITLAIKGRKPVPVYTTDRWTSFGLLVSISRLMRWGGELPPIVVIAIGYVDEQKGYADDTRALDLTPTGNPGLDPKDLGNGKYGGSAAFRRFIVDKLQPEVRRRGDFDHDNAVLVGHSFGGLFAVDTMVNAPGAFKHYLAVSPSLWFDDRIVMRQLTTALGAGTSYPGRMAVYIGEHEERISPPKARMVSNVLDLQRLVADHRSQFAAPLVQVLPGLSHHTIMGIACTYGLQYLLSPPERLAETY